LGVWGDAAVDSAYGAVEGVDDVAPGAQRGWGVWVLGGLGALGVGFWV
jgi:hypothetical protein